MPELPAIGLRLHGGLDPRECIELADIAEAPIYVAAMGDRSLELCGSPADGLIVSNLCPPLYTERAVAILRRAAVEAGRPPPAVVQYVPCIPSSDRDEARRTAMTHIGEMMAAFWP